jgi:hypothetical protein
LEGIHTVEKKKTKITNVVYGVFAATAVWIGVKEWDAFKRPLRLGVRLIHGCQLKSNSLLSKMGVLRGWKTFTKWDNIFFQHKWP